MFALQPCDLPAWLPAIFAHCQAGTSIHAGTQTATRQSINQSQSYSAGPLLEMKPISVSLPGWHTQATARLAAAATAQRELVAANNTADVMNEDASPHRCT